MSEKVKSLPTGIALEDLEDFMRVTALWYVQVGDEGWQATEAWSGTIMPMPPLSKDQGALVNFMPDGRWAEGRYVNGHPGLLPLDEERAELCDGRWAVAQVVLTACMDPAPPSLLLNSRLT